MRNFLPNAAGFVAAETFPCPSAPSVAIPRTGLWTTLSRNLWRPLDCNQSTCNAGHVWAQRLDLASKKRARVGCDHRGLCKPLGTGAGFGASDHALKTSDNAAYS